MRTHTNIFISIGCSLLFFSKVATAQDPIFSQYFVSPLTINPSFLGKDVQNTRATFNTRTQWWGNNQNLFSTTTVAIEQRIGKSESNVNNLSIGCMVLSDQSNNGLLKNNYATAAVAYNKALDKKGSMHIGLGLSFTYANRLVDQSKFESESQFASLGFQGALASNNVAVLGKNNYFEVNTGVNFSKVNEKNGFRIGVGYFHASKPKVGAFTTNQFSVDPRLSVQLSGFTELKNKNELHVTTNTEMQGSFNVFTAGAIYKLFIGSEVLSKVNIGCFKRFGDAVYPYLGLENDKCLVAFTYDFSTNGSKTTSVNIQSLELSLAWKFGKKKSTSDVKQQVISY